MTSCQSPPWRLTELSGRKGVRAEWQDFPVYCFLGQTPSQLDKIVNQFCMTENLYGVIAAASNLSSNAISDASSRHNSRLTGVEDY